MEALPSLSVECADGRYDVQRDAAPPSGPTMPPHRSAELHRLMMLADRYARQMVAAAEAPSDALMLVHQGALDILALDGRAHVTGAVCRLVTRYQASSAVLIVHASDSTGTPAQHAYHLIGETVDGLRETWHYRVRGCATSSRLTRQTERDGATEHEVRAYALFPRRPGAALATSQVSRAR